MFACFLKAVDDVSGGGGVLLYLQFKGVAPDMEVDTKVVWCCGMYYDGDKQLDNIFTNT